MNIRYQREIDAYYLILCQEAGQISFEHKMLESNTFQTLLPIQVRLTPDGLEYHYEITAKQALKNWMLGRYFRITEIRKILESINAAITEIENHLLNMDNLILDAEFLYMEPNSLTLSFCYLPNYNKTFTGSMRELMQYFIRQVDHREEASMAAAYDLYHSCLNDHFSMGQLLQLAAPKGEPIEPETVMRDSVKEDCDSGKGRTETVAFHLKSIIFLLAAFAVTVICLFVLGDLWVHRSQLTNEGYVKGLGIILIEIATIGMLKTYLLETYSSRRSEPKCETTSIPAETSVGETCILTQSVTPFRGRKRLASLKPELYPDISIVKYPFVIGKLGQVTDYTLDFQTISRIHACLEIVTEDYFLTDLNSTNGTYLNGKRLTANNPVKIRDGDEIWFADYGYVFCEN